MVRKCCTKCGEEKTRTREYFPLNKGMKDGLDSWCRKCHNAADVDWRKKNPEKNRKYSREFQRRNRKKRNDYQREYHKTLEGHISQLMGNIKQRCTNPNDPKYKNYGGRGIKCKFTRDELYNWLIVNGINPKGFDIHRIDNDGDYTLNNIRFLTKSEHGKLQRKLE